MSLGMTLIRANTLAFGLIGKDGPHGIIKICFGNMNLVFGSEVSYWDFGNICFEFSLECGANFSFAHVLYIIFTISVLCPVP
jgi:hypothetical protein